jgi:hypothetical protein
MRVTTKQEIDQPFLAPLGEVIYELIGRLSIAQISHK